MKISRDWLQKYFDKPLPSAHVLADALTFHAFEIESIENDILDVKVTANRGHDCLCHRGIAKELCAILPLPMKFDPLRQEHSLAQKTDSVSVSVEDPILCPRYIAAFMRGVKVGPSPEWLRKAVESVGQKSINNIVDATNFVMFDLGQPLHAFDASKLTNKSGYAIGVRKAREGEKILALDGGQYALTNSMQVIIDAHSDTPIGIAGVKGGRPASITESTHDIIIESANFDGISVRKTAQALKIRTDASSRYEQGISPELCAYGMYTVVDLIVRIASGTLIGYVDVYPNRQQQTVVQATTGGINAILGTQLTDDDIASVLERLDLDFTKAGDAFSVEPPLERLDISIPEDIAEEVGRILGYDKVPTALLPALPHQPAINGAYLAAEKKRQALIAEGYSEVLTSVFAEKGERVVANKVDGVRPYLRATLVEGLKEAYEKNKRNKELLGLDEVKLFEIGSAWTGGNEVMMIGTADPAGVREESLASIDATAYEDLALSPAQRYQPFSKYPFILRDIALWVPTDTKADSVAAVIKEHAGDLLVREPQLFDEFAKGDRLSYAFRLVFQSFDRTLTDEDANERMASISGALKAKGFEIR